MGSVEQIRKDVLAPFTAAHTAAYPNTLVNYPNLVVVDLERQVDPFISVELTLGNGTQAELGSTETIDVGVLAAYHYMRTGTGTSAGYVYADILKAALELKTVNGITFGVIKTVPVISFKGWEGLACSIPFTVAEEIC